MADYRRVKTAVVSDTGEKSVIIGPDGVKVPSGDVKLTVGEVEKLTGTSRETLRFYDDKGLLRPARTGSGVSNNRKLYSPDDLERLQEIQTLRAYDFSLEEIGRVLDGGADIYDVMTEKLAELKRREARLRALVLFAKFVDLSDEDLLEGLANGPEYLDALSDLARSKASHEEALTKLDAMDEEEAARALGALHPIVSEMMLLDDVKGFAGTGQCVDAFFAWWDATIVPIDRIGYLGFWAVFEDHSLIPEYIETIGHTGDAGIVQMCTFFVFITRFAKANSSLIADIAALAASDIVAAMEKAHELITAVAFAMLGTEEAPIPDTVLADLAYYALAYIAALLEDCELSGYLGLSDGLPLDGDSLEKALQVVDIMGSEA